MLATEREDGVARGLLRRVAEARTHSDELFSIVREGSFYERPIPERHRIVFYLGHLEAFDWNLLRERMLRLSSSDPELDRLFAFGIDPVGGGLPTDQLADWPLLAEVRHYVNEIRGKIDDSLEKFATEEWDAPLGGDESSAGALLNVAIEHRLMHVETLAYMLHQLPLDHKIAVNRQGAIVRPAVSHATIEIAAGNVTLGLARESGLFGWDNEFEQHNVDVPAFAIDKYPVTNEQFLNFVATGGYEKEQWWKPEDWAWKQKHGIEHPAFWRRRHGQWYFVTMFDEISLPSDWPVYVSHAEASAYARWAGKALPTEVQWHRAACGTPEGSERCFPWGNERADSKLGNFDFRSWDPAPVNAFPRGDSAFGVSCMLGNGWEWTSTQFAAFEGFQAFPFYPGYSANFFDGKHYVLKGGSARTAACMLRRSFRNWFQPHYQYVYAGFRCVSN